MRDVASLGSLDHESSRENSGARHRRLALGEITVAANAGVGSKCLSFYFTSRAKKSRAICRPTIIMWHAFLPLARGLSFSLFSVFSYFSFYHFASQFAFKLFFFSPFSINSTFSFFLNINISIKNQ